MGPSTGRRGYEIADQPGQFGCDLVQGFRFSEALPEGEATDRILQGRQGPPA